MRVTVTSLRTRLQMAREILKAKDYNAQVMSCGYCGSTHINKRVDNGKSMNYAAMYFCEKCGSKCIEQQKWTHRGEQHDSK